MEPSIDRTTNEFTANLPLQGMHVLLCEDCVDQSRIILKILQVFGAEVTLECNGLSAVKTFQMHPTKFDAIVMDFQMPEMDGLVATLRIRDLNYAGTIIAVTAFGTEYLKQAWFEAGCDEYLIKPLQASQILVALLNHMETAAS